MKAPANTVPMWPHYLCDATNYELGGYKGHTNDNVNDNA